MNDAQAGSFFPRPDTDRDSSPERVAKVERNGLLYKKKKANLPFLKSHRWPEKVVKRSDTMSKESSPPYERASDVSRSILRYSALLVLGTLLLSRMFTETWLFGLETANLMRWIPRPMKTFTETELLRFDGTDPANPKIYLALDGDVFDVSENPRMYGKGGSYSHFAGKDAARAFVTGCFKTHLTHDLRGLSAKDLKSLDGWKSFFRKHAKYFQVGHVLHDSIPADAPIPLPCVPNEEEYISSIPTRS